nr:MULTISPECIES: TIR domain-containing protein [Streptomyces]
MRDGGLEVFTDETGVESFAGISDTIRRELSRSKALLAFYSTGYPEREACQWELTTAYLAGLGEGNPRRRVMVVNPEPTTHHIHPVELRDARHASADDLTALVPDVRAHVARLDGPMTLKEHRVRRWLLGSPQSAPSSWDGSPSSGRCTPPCTPTPRRSSPAARRRMPCRSGAWRASARPCWHRSTPFASRPRTPVACAG